MIQVFDVWAEWCPPCKKFGPIFSQVASEYGDRAVFTKVDADTDQGNEFLNEYGIRGIPTILILDSENSIIFQHAGILSADAFRSVLDSHIAK